MKYIYVIVLGIMMMLTQSVKGETTVASLSDSLKVANDMCRDGQMAQAIDTYEMILESGYSSAELYYNLGYAYFKQGSLGRAILNFERSKRLNPTDEDVLTNLELAYSQTDKLEIEEPFFIVTFWQGIRDSMGSDGWAWLFVVLFVVALVGVALFVVSASVAMRKAGFFSALVLLILAVIALAISMNKRSEILDGSEGIILSSSVSLSTSPDKNGNEMAVLHEGTHVTVISTLGEWSEVRLKDGNVGWLKTADFEKI